MIRVHPFETLGHAQLGWLDSRHHFSFASYHDPDRMGFGPLRVWNDDVIAPGTGFDLHGHRDMEIITYVRRGAITHQDHLKNLGRTVAGDVQVMSAGRGIMHSEFNRESQPTEIFQIWIQPALTGVRPRWAAKQFPKSDRTGMLVPLASGRIDSADILPIHQDATLFGATVAAGQGLSVDVAPGRLVYLVPSTGDITVNGVFVPNRSGVLVSDETNLVLTGAAGFEILLADLPAV